MSIPVDRQKSLTVQEFNLFPVAERNSTSLARATSFWFRRQLSIVLTVITITSALDYAAVTFLKIRTGGVEYKRWGPSTGKAIGFAEGSSLMEEGLSWSQVASELGGPVENWFVAGSSPTEWEQLQSRASNVGVTFIGVSPYDLNEEFLCDSRADVVPLHQAIADLWHTHASWTFSKRVLGQYPVRYCRLLFPTIGRSDGIMVGFRARLAQVVSPWASVTSEAGPTVRDQNLYTEKLSNWSKARALRRVTLMRTASRNRHIFNGPKRLALMRMLRDRPTAGPAILIVLPVSKMYKRELLNPDSNREFERVIAEAQNISNSVRVVRLDRLPQLDSDEMFWDLVHLNVYGEKIATEAFLAQLGQIVGQVDRP